MKQRCDKDQKKQQTAQNLNLPSSARDGWVVSVSEADVVSQVFVFTGLSFSLVFDELTKVQNVVSS